MHVGSLGALLPFRCIVFVIPTRLSKDALLSSFVLKASGRWTHAPTTLASHFPIAGHHLPLGLYKRRHAPSENHVVLDGADAMQSLALASSTPP
jgi:hypothetical protein